MTAAADTRRTKFICQLEIGIRIRINSHVLSTFELFRVAAFPLWNATKCHKQKTLISPRFIYDFVRFGPWCFH